MLSRSVDSGTFMCMKVLHRVELGVGEWVRSQSSNVVGETVHKGARYGNIYSAEDCGIYIVIIIFIYYFLHLEQLDKCTQKSTIL